MRDVTAATAFAAGVASFLSPCVLPLVPGYVSYISGLTIEELTREDAMASGAGRRKAGPAAVAFVLGFSAVFTLLGATASAAGNFLGANHALFSRAAGIVIVLFGLHTMGVLPIKWLYYEKRFQATGVAPGLLGAFVMGLAFAFGWTPCIGPILSAILALAAKESSVAGGMTLLFVYSLGLGIPFIATGFATAGFMRFFQRYKRFIRWGEAGAGALLVLIGLLIFSNRLTALISLFPRWLFKFAL